RKSSNSLSTPEMMFGDRARCSCATRSQLCERGRHCMQPYSRDPGRALESASQKGDIEPWLIFLDIDGTLVDRSHRPRPSATRAVREARARGHRVYLSTGRSRSGISDEIMDIGFDGVVSASGSFVEADGS